MRTIQYLGALAAVIGGLLTDLYLELFNRFNLFKALDL